MSAVTAENLAVAHGAVRAVRSVSLTAGTGEVVTLLGPSGCGKTTTLRAIAGLERPSAGRVRIGDRTVFDAARGIDLPPDRRGLAMVFQSYAIWPHMSVFENVAFPLRARRVARAEIAPMVRRSLDSVGLGAYADRPATRLSGGQQQRVALARAIAGNPGVILLDEPLSNLDAQLRLAMRAEFKTLQRKLGLTAIYVTHDQEEALVLSERILVLRDGAIEQEGTPTEIHDRPRTRFVAAFMGVGNILPCMVARDGDRCIAVLGDGVRLTVPGDRSVPDCCACFRPAAVTLSAIPAPDAFAATIESATFSGDWTEYELRSFGLTIRARRLGRGDLPIGAQVFWSVPPDACFLVPE